MAKDIFDKSIFDGYRVESLTESVQDIIPKYNFDGSTKTTVFISHKHDDLDEIKGLIGLLEKKYNIKAYIDSWDKSMPKSHRNKYSSLKTLSAPPWRRIQSSPLSRRTPG